MAHSVEGRECAGVEVLKNYRATSSERTFCSTSDVGRIGGTGKLDPTRTRHGAVVLPTRVTPSKVPRQLPEIAQAQSPANIFRLATEKGCWSGKWPDVVGVGVGVGAGVGAWADKEGLTQETDAEQIEDEGSKGVDHLGVSASGSLIAANGKERETTGIEGWR